MSGNKKYENKCSKSQKNIVKQIATALNTLIQMQSNDCKTEIFEAVIKELSDSSYGYNNDNVKTKDMQTKLQILSLVSLSLFFF